MLKRSKYLKRFEMPLKIWISQAHLSENLSKKCRTAIEFEIVIEKESFRKECIKRKELGAVSAQRNNL